MAEYLVPGADFLDENNAGADYVLPGTGFVQEDPAPPPVTSSAQPVVMVIT